MSLLVSLLILTACGGGGGDDDSTPTDLSVLFDITELNSLNVGLKYEFYLEGTDSNDHDWEGSIIVTIGANVTIDGVTYIPEELLTSLTHIPTNQVFTSTITGYYYLSGEPDYFISIDSEGGYMHCDAVTVYASPDFVSIGDTGNMTQYSCNRCTDDTCADFDNYFYDIRGTWSVENGYDGYAYLVFDTERLDVQTDTSIEEIKKFKIDISGTIVSFTFTTYFPDGYWRTLTSL
ncbi:MAG: hypothetical protein QNJ78_00975 [Gammaproteobacteria bacterium]|nr:hypothetical protein [Gammaproteobacteria bacterium]